MKFILACLLALGLTGCLGSGGGGSSKDWGGWDMDPRLEAIALWAHNGAAMVTEQDPNSYVPPVQGVNGMWGNNNTFGTYYGGNGWRKSFIRSQIDRPGETHVQDIIAHEMGHYFKHMKTGNASGETYANWVNREIRRLEAAGLIPPAPGIDWDAVRTSTVKPGLDELDTRPRGSNADDKD